MYDLPHTGGGNIPGLELTSIQAMLDEFKKTVSQIASMRGLPLGHVPALRPCNLLVILTKSKVHVAFSDKNAGGLPRKQHADQRALELSADRVRQAAVDELYFEAPYVISFDTTLIGKTAAERVTAVSDIANEYVDEQYKEFKRMKAPIGFEQLQPSLDKFFGDHPVYENNVFVMMRFRNADH